jgi:hypothetical protein
MNRSPVKKETGNYYPGDNDPEDLCTNKKSARSSSLPVKRTDSNTPRLFGAASFNRLPG